MMDLKCQGIVLTGAETLHMSFIRLQDHNNSLYHINSRVHTEHGTALATHMSPGEGQLPKTIEKSEHPDVGLQS